MTNKCKECVEMEAKERSIRGLRYSDFSTHSWKPNPFKKVDPMYIVLRADGTYWQGASCCIYSARYKAYTAVQSRQPSPEGEKD